jgi:hypothetical protein
LDTGESLGPEVNGALRTGEQREDSWAREEKRGKGKATTTKAIEAGKRDGSVEDAAGVGLLAYNSAEHWMQR